MHRHTARWAKMDELPSIESLELEDLDCWGWADWVKEDLV